MTAHTTPQLILPLSYVTLQQASAARCARAGTCAAISDFDFGPMRLLQRRASARRRDLPLRAVSLPPPPVFVYVHCECKYGLVRHLPRRCRSRRRRTSSRSLAPPALQPSTLAALVALRRRGRLRFVSQRESPSSNSSALGTAKRYDRDRHAY